MMNQTIEQLAHTWASGLTTFLLDMPTLEKFIIEAAREYQAWGFLAVDKAHLDESMQWQCQPVHVDAQTTLTVAEWGVIKPLAHLFAERETALIQESSRMVSFEAFGRSSNEIEADITAFRNEYFRREAFSLPAVSV